MRQIKNYSQVYSSDDNESLIKKDERLNNIEFYNDADSANDLFINERRVPIGASWSPSANANEIDISDYRLRYGTANVGTTKLIVTQKVYVD